MNYRRKQRIIGKALKVLKDDYPNSDVRIKIVLKEDHDHVSAVHMEKAFSMRRKEYGERHNSMMPSHKNWKYVVLSREDWTSPDISIFL